MCGHLPAQMLSASKNGNTGVGDASVEGNSHRTDPFLVHIATSAIHHLDHLCDDTSVQRPHRVVPEFCLQERRRRRSCVDVQREATSLSLLTVPLGVERFHSWCSLVATVRDDGIWSLEFSPGDAQGTADYLRLQVLLEIMFIVVQWFYVLWVHVFLEYVAMAVPKFASAPGPSGDRGGTPRWGLMAGSAACFTTYTRHCPLVPVQSRPAELPATSVGRWRRRHSLRRHKGGTRVALFTSRHQALLQGGFNVSLRNVQQGLKVTSVVTGPVLGVRRHCKACEAMQEHRRVPLA